MSAPPPPPPPPPPAPAAPPPPPIGGGGGGGPAFLADICKGVGLKKVPDSMKNDRSAPVKGDSGGGSGGGGGGGVARAPSSGGGMGGGMPSQADIKSKLNAMFGGAAAPYTPKTAAPASPAPASPQQPPVPPCPPPSRGPCGSREPAPPPPPAPGASSEASGPYRSRAPPPAIPNRGYKSRVSVGQSSMNGSMDYSADPWAGRFTFPDKSTFPKPPAPYTGTKTYIGHRQE